MQHSGYEFMLTRGGSTAIMKGCTAVEWGMRIMCRS